jgi:hypothetical protein
VCTLLRGKNFVFAGWNQWEVLEAASDAPPPFRHLPLPGREHIVRLMNEAVENGLKAGSRAKRVDRTLQIVRTFSHSRLKLLYTKRGTPPAGCSTNETAQTNLQYNTTRSIRCNSMRIACSECGHLYRAAHNSSPSCSLVDTPSGAICIAQMGMGMILLKAPEEVLNSLTVARGRAMYMCGVVFYICDHIHYS